MSRGLAAAPPVFATRRALVVGLALLGLASFALLGLGPAGLVPNGGGLRLAGEFLGAAFRPAVGYEASFVPPGEATADLLEKLAFRRHRRQVAGVRQPRRTGSESGITRILR